MNGLERVEEWQLTPWMRKQGLEAVLIGIDYDGDWEVVEGRAVWAAFTLHGIEGHKITFLALKRGDDGAWGGGWNRREMGRWDSECLEMLGRLSGGGLS